ncbi:SDR family oxidoreductase [bacterium]|nr:MAG: SDR family oxidoreductase [bacterium]
MKVLVTGAKGFVGKNLCLALRERKEVEVFKFDIDNSQEELKGFLAKADIVFHLAGVNRPRSVEEFKSGNVGFTGELCNILRSMGRKPKVILTSSIQAERDNPYGASKLGAEGELESYCAATGAEGVVYRLKNLFGKWCRPNYNSVTATFCNNIAKGLPIQVSDPACELELTYIDDVVVAFLAELEAAPRPGFRFAEELKSTRITLGELSGMIQGFKRHRETLLLPDYSREFVRALYATYLTYLEPSDYGYGLDIKADDRGSLAEFIKSPHFGQIFISRTRPGITRGNHYHHTKTEKFMVVEGSGIIRLRSVFGGEVLEFPVRGEEYKVVDIPPGYTHSIENTGSSEMVTLFWASEQFNPGNPDTFFAPVLGAGEGKQ